MSVDPRNGFLAWEEGMDMPWKAKVEVEASNYYPLFWFGTFGPGDEKIASGKRIDLYLFRIRFTLAWLRFRP